MNLLARAKQLAKPTQRPQVSRKAKGIATKDVLETFPNWRGVLVKSRVLGCSVWVVRTHEDGVGFARDTGHPALLLDDVVSRKGEPSAEVRAALLPLVFAKEEAEEHQAMRKEYFAPEGATDFDITDCETI